MSLLAWQWAIACAMAAVGMTCTYLIGRRNSRRALEAAELAGHERGWADRNAYVERRMRDGWRLYLGDDGRPRWVDYAQCSVPEPTPPAPPPLDTVGGACSPGAGGVASDTPIFDKIGLPPWAWPAELEAAPVVAIDPRGITVYGAAGAELEAALPPIVDLSTKPWQCPGCLCLFERPGYDHEPCFDRQVRAANAQVRAADDAALDVLYADDPPVPEADLAELRHDVRAAAGLPDDTGQWHVDIEAARAAWCARAGILYEPIAWED